MSASPSWPKIIHGERVERDVAVLREAAPWCADFLSRPNTIVTATACEYPGPWNHPTFGSMFNKTLRGDGTFLAYVALYTDPEPDPKAPVLASPLTPGGVPLQRLSTLASLGSAMDGWNGVLAGSAAMALMDDCMSSLILNNGGLLVGQLPQQPEDRWQAVMGPGAVLGKLGMITADFHIKYRRPVVTPSVVRVDAWFVEVTEKLKDGRQRMRIESCIMDGKGRELIKSEATWFTVGEDLMAKTRL